MWGWSRQEQRRGRAEIAPRSRRDRAEIAPPSSASAAVSTSPLSRAPSAPPPVLLWLSSVTVGPAAVGSPAAICTWQVADLNSDARADAQPPCGEVKAGLDRRATGETGGLRPAA